MSTNELVNFLREELGGRSFEEKKEVLTSAPYYLAVKEAGELYNVIFTDKSPKINDENSPTWMRNCVGAIFEKGTDKLVAYPFDRTVELVVDPRDLTGDADNNTKVALKTLQQEVIDSVHIYGYVEGVKLTLFNYNNEWRLCTSRCIDANKAFWSSDQSFLEQFVETCTTKCPHILSQMEGSETGSEKESACRLDKETSYTFLLCSPDNKFVTDVSEQNLFHIASYSTAKLQAVDADIGVKKPSRVSFDSFQELIESMADFNYFNAGYIVTGKQRYKVLFSEYASVKDLRGTTPCSTQTYLDSRRHKEKLKALLQYYPEYRRVAAKVERDLRTVVDVVFKTYIKYFITREARVFLPKPLHVTLMQLHAKSRIPVDTNAVVLMTTGRVRMTPQRVTQHIGGLPTRIQMTLIETCTATSAAAVST